MCGICGIIERDPRSRPDASRLRKMAATIRHRGPDDEGVRTFNQVGLGHRRLSIIDLSDAGHQPMSNEDGTIWVVFNGEIYNFSQLRQTLKRHHEFRSDTDTEILLHLYEERGVDMLDLLDGMFAFAIVDLNQRQILLARDPFGIKPLYYSLDKSRLVFGSEIKPVLASGMVSRELDPAALNDYFDFLWIPAPRTIFRDVRKLLPATAMTLDMRTWETSFRTYWQPEYQPRQGQSAEQWSEEVEELLHRTVQSQMVSDVPLGTFLSGGIDSTLITQHAAHHVSQKLQTFSIDFDDQASSEAEAASYVAETLQTNAIFRTLPYESINRLAELAEFYDEPFADSSLLPTSAVCRVAREQVTVVLSGDGGDELFTGYRHYWLASKLSRLDGLPGRLAQPLFGTAATLAPKGTRLREWGRRLALPDTTRRLTLLRLPGRGSRTEILDAEIREPVDARWWHLEQHLPRLRGLPAVTQSQFYDLCFYLPNDMLVKVDRASMACGLEVRVPFLSRALAELAYQIPESVRYHQDTSKPLLRRLVAKRFGTELAYQPKHAFSIPRKTWMTTAASSQTEQAILQSAPVREGCLDHSGVQRLFSDIRRGGGKWYVDRTEELFSLLVFVAWWQRHLDEEYGA